MKRGMFCALALVLACGGGEEQAANTNEANEPGPAGAGGANTPQGNSTVTGTVRFTGTAPANPPIDMSQEEACRAKHDAAPHDPQYVVKDGKLGNVFVHVKGGLPADAKYAAPRTSVTIDQDGCIYKPRIFGVMPGQQIEIKNSDPVLHNIKAVPKENRGFNISQPSQGMVTRRNFTKPEVMVPLECNVHSWMQAYVGVLPHPYFATTGEDGTFKITGLPQGTYQVEAWHEKLGTQTGTVTVGDSETKTLDFSFAPRA